MDHLENIVVVHHEDDSSKEVNMGALAALELKLLVLPPRNRMSSVSSGGSNKRDSQYKGFNLNLNLSISPETTPTKSHTRGAATSSNAAFSAAASPAKEELPETVLPSVETLQSMEIDDQMRLLALTEMNIVDIKDNIRKLQEKLLTQEQNVAKLRKFVQRSLYRELTTAQSELFKRNTPGDKTRPRSLVVSSLVSSDNSTSDQQSKIWAKLSNTISMMQQFDNKLLNEFEKSLNSEVPTQKTPPNTASGRKVLGHHPAIKSHSQSRNPNKHQKSENRLSGTHLTSRASSMRQKQPARSPLKPFNTHPRSPEKRYVDPDPVELDENGNKQSGFDGAEELFESVQNSIWTFVKTNVLSGYEDNLLSLVLARLQDDDDFKKSNKELQRNSRMPETPQTNRETTPGSVRLDVLNTSSIDNLLDVTSDTGEGEGEDLVTVDLSMYSNMRR